MFAGGFDLAVVEAVVADGSISAFDAVDLLDRLVDKSLVAVDVSTGATRYRLLETIRDYGWERLTEAEEAATFTRRHAECFAAFSERAGAGLRGPDERHWSDLIETEMENLRLALASAIETEQADLALRIVAGLAISGSRLGVPFGTSRSTRPSSMVPMGIPRARWRSRLQHGRPFASASTNRQPSWERPP